MQIIFAVSQKNICLFWNKEIFTIIEYYKKAGFDNICYDVNSLNINSTREVCLLPAILPDGDRTPSLSELTAYSLDYLDNDNNGASIQMYNAIRQIGRLATNESLNDYYERFNSLYLDFTDLVDEFKKEFSNDNIDLSRLDDLSNEITKINRLKRKYNVDNLLEYKNKLVKELKKATGLPAATIIKQLNYLKYLKN